MATGTSIGGYELDVVSLDLISKTEIIDSEK